MNPRAFYPTQQGYLPTGVNGTALVSTYFLGRNTSGTYEGIGIGQGGRPDPLQVLNINLTSPNGGTPFQKGTITINVEDLMNIVGGPSRYNMTLKEVHVCENGTNKKMIVLASQTYT